MRFFIGRHIYYLIFIEDHYIGSIAFSQQAAVFQLKRFGDLQAAGLDRAKSALGGSKRRRVRSLSRASLEEGR